MMLTLTFKDSEKWIYDEICSHSSKGGFIKDVLAEYIKNMNSQADQPKKEDIETKSNIDVANFLNF